MLNAMEGNTNKQVTVHYHAEHPGFYSLSHVLHVSQRKCKAGICVFLLVEDMLINLGVFSNLFGAATVSLSSG